MAVPLARRNLLSEKTRLIISIGGVALAILLILIVLALYRGWSRSGEVFEQLPGQLWVTQHGTSDPFHSLSLLEPHDVEAAAAADGVDEAVPVLSRQMNITANGREESVRFMALDIPAGFPVDSTTSRHFLPDAGEVVIEKTLSRKTGLGEGDTVTVAGVDLTVQEVQPRGGDVLSQFVFLNFADAREVFGVGEVVNYAMLIVTPGVDPALVASQLEAEHAGLQVYTSSEFAHAVRKELDESFIPVIAILVAIGFIVGTAVIGLTIYTATIERTREYGVMKALGASPGFLYRIVLSQSAILTGAGYVAGVLAALATARLAERGVPEFATDFRTADVVAVFVVTVVMAFVASFVPVRRINSIDPAMVFRA